jgi:hypothetical protein
MSISRRVLSITLLAFCIIILAQPRSTFAAGNSPVINSGHGTPATTITSYSLTCSSLTVSGTTPASYIGMYVQDNDTAFTLVYLGAGQGIPASGGQYSVTVNFAPRSVGTHIYFNVQGSLNSNGEDAWDGKDFAEVLSVTCPTSWSAPAAKMPFTDGRINPDAGASVVGYCGNKGSIEGYTPTGRQVFNVTAAKIAAALAEAVATDTNVLIAQGLGQQLWALKSNELQLLDGTGGGYRFVFRANYCA